MVYRKIAIGVGVIALAATLVDASRQWGSEAHDPFHYTFSNDSRLDVDNVNGTIDVTGDGGNKIRVDGERITHAEDQQALDRAKRDVKLDVNEKDGTAQFYVNGPFRNNNRADDAHGFHLHYDDHDYEVVYNFTVHVPHETALRLRTVNGQINTGDTRGKFDVSGVNGAVSMTGVAGYGSLRTVNGHLTVSFRESPKQACEFKTVNGAITASFPPNLAAELHFRNLNGGTFTDFETTSAVPTTAEAGQRVNGKFVFHPNRGSVVRVGSGGPALSFETLNGTINIRKETH